MVTQYKRLEFKKGKILPCIFLYCIGPQLKSGLRPYIHITETHNHGGIDHRFRLRSSLRTCFAFLTRRTYALPAPSIQTLSHQPIHRATRKNQR